LRQGIRDGFLAPYKVVKVHIDRWCGRIPRPEKGDTRPRGRGDRGLRRLSQPPLAHQPAQWRQEVWFLSCVPLFRSDALFRLGPGPWNSPADPRLAAFARL